MHDKHLGGKDNYSADREAAGLAMAATPMIVRANRRFLGRAVRYMAQADIRQFLDVGTGFPTVSNTHEVAQSAAPGCRVVCVDNDPIVFSHARALLTGRAGATAYIDADARDTAKILAGRTLDFSQPVQEWYPESALDLDSPPTAMRGCPARKRGWSGPSGAGARAMTSAGAMRLITWDLPGLHPQAHRLGPTPSEVRT
jgi:hypothetical protein